MIHFFRSIHFRFLTWLILVIFLQTLIPQSLWAGSPWAQRRDTVQEESPDPVGATDRSPVLEESPPIEYPPAPQPVGKKRDEINEVPILAANLPPTDPLQPTATDLTKPNSKLKTQNSELALPIAAVLDVYSTTLSDTELRLISSSFRREVKNTGRFLVYNKTELKKALSKNLDQEIAAAKQIDEYVSQARRLYDDFKFDSAAAIMKEAMKAIATFDATPAVARKISEAYLTQGLILDAQNQEKDSDVAFLNAAALDPERQLDPTRYPPSVIGKFYKAKADYTKIKKGSLRIETTPPVADVILGDRQLGTTPATLKDLPLGVQKISLFKDGYDPWEKNVMIVATSPGDYVNRVEVDLNRLGQSVSLDALIGEVVSRKDYDSQLSKLADVGKLMVADQVFAARIEKGERGFDLFITEVDSQTSREIAKGYALIDPNLADVDVSMAHALSDMLAGRTAAKTPDLIAVEGKGGHYLASYKKSKPFYKRWPFFLIIGVVVAGGGAGAAFALTRSGTPTGSATIGGPPQP